MSKYVTEVGEPPVPFLLDSRASCLLDNIVLFMRHDGIKITEASLMEELCGLRGRSLYNLHYNGAALTLYTACGFGALITKYLSLVDYDKDGVPQGALAIGQNVGAEDMIVGGGS